MLKTISSIVIAGLILLGAWMFLAGPGDVLLQGYVTYNTWANGTTNSTTTINTTSTQVFASVSKWAAIVNPTTAEITCSLDDLGTTAASSTVGTHKGYVIGPHDSASSTNLPAILQFGECGPGSYNCIPFNGTVNCVASSQAVVSTISR